MATTDNNVVSKIPTNQSVITRLNAFLLALTTCALLFIALKIQTAEAHSVLDNSIRGPDTNGQYRRSHNNERGRLKDRNLVLSDGRCGDDWIKVENKCWLFTTTRRDRDHGSKYCADYYSNATLPTIYSQEENDMLKSQMKTPNLPLWLDAFYNHQYNKTYWGIAQQSKSTPQQHKRQAIYTNWDQGQPAEKPSLICINTTEFGIQISKGVPSNQDHSNGGCVTFWDDGKWGTQVGCSVLLPIVCELKISPPARYSATERPNSSSASINAAEQMTTYSSANTFNTNNNHHLTSIIIYILISLTICATLNQQRVALVR